MGEGGVMEEMKQGALTGTVAGFAIGSSRAFLSAREFADKARETAAAARAANPRLTPSAVSALTPSPLVPILSTTAAYAAIGSAYLGVRKIAHDTRDKDDLWNGVIAGLFAGSLVGIRRSSVAISGGAAASLAAVSAFSSLLSGHFIPTDDPVIQARKASYR